MIHRRIVLDSCSGVPVRNKLRLREEFKIETSPRITLTYLSLFGSLTYFGTTVIISMSKLY